MDITTPTICGALPGRLAIVHGQLKRWLFRWLNDRRHWQIAMNALKRLVGPAGLEPATRSL